MAKVISFSTKFPPYHPNAGEPTFFVEKCMASFADHDSNWKMLDSFTHYDEITL